MSNITKETRRQSYEEIIADLGKRQKRVLESLQKYGDVTAGELAHKMYVAGMINTNDRNSVHPRLHELEEKELIAIVGKRRCEISGKTCAVYRAKEGTYRYGEN